MTITGSAVSDFSTDTDSPVVIIGAGHAGANLAALVRQEGFTGDVILLGDEVHDPYHRPPLSKKFMGDSLEQPLRGQGFYDEMKIDTRFGSRAARILPSERAVETADGSRIEYGTLVIATGSRPRRLNLPGADAEGVMTLRTLDDARTLRSAVQRGGRLVIIGGGYIGLEVAAEARVHDLAVSVLEREERVLARVASHEFSTLLTDHHRVRGTDILTGVDVVGLATDGGAVIGVELADGTSIPCDAVLVGVGAIPNDELAADCGINCADGIVVDENGRTSVPHVFAVGDATRRPVGGDTMRFESIPSAMEQAKRVAACIAGTPLPGAEVPWFWSDQFDLKLKIAGLVHHGVSVCRRGDAGAAKFGIFHLDDHNRLVAVETANAPSFFMAGKKFIASSAVLDPQRIADPDTDLRSCLAG
ncbi:NAD(P)/FAD-dependent oxidoreductase [Gordonia aichiensis]|uniref:Putative ferredoxin reductase n=1 Tax=Gordonia aichiensis NBRC 108223 TaxID=1220583 RepID=L7KMJ3_9ACTN|nr:FAD-dependent oxidoreductase [Gordonia aichiensis]GAC49177.1 putative ferredoxin reductase [Gordonia aichiensis NBRC 108223]